MRPPADYNARGLATLAQPPVDAALSLQALVDSARQALGRERRSLSAAVAARCSELARTPTRRNADLLLSLVEGREVTSLMGPDGRSCWVAATEALLSMGYPYALEISPEALERYRRSERALDPSARARRRIWIGLWVAFVLYLVLAVLVHG